VCAEHGCAELTDEARCDAHRRATDRARRAEVQRLKYGGEWVKLRRAQLRQHPTCQCGACGDHAAPCGAPAVDVDHITPLRLFAGDRRAAHHPSNLQSLCERCHGRKTAAEVRARSVTAELA
jgi:5-methylcytosine-specific restriction protein A